MAANNLGVLYTTNGDLFRSYICLSTAGFLKNNDKNNFITEVYNLANITLLLGNYDLSYKLYVYCYRWYNCRIPINYFSIARCLFNILDLQMMNLQFGEALETLNKIINEIRILMGLFIIIRN